MERIHEIEELRKRKELKNKKNQKEIKEEKEFLLSKKLDKTAKILVEKRKKNLDLDKKAIQ